MKIIISKQISEHVLMTGVYFKNNHPGGISAVVQYWSNYIDGLQFIPTFKEGTFVHKFFIFLVALLRVIFKCIFNQKIKILHIHTAAGSDFRRSSYLIKIAKFFNKKVILHSHASQFKLYYNSANASHKARILNVLNTVDTLIVLSQSWKDWFINIGVTPSKLVILHNITSYPDLPSVKRELISPLRFLFLGEIGKRKGIFDIIKVLSSHKDDIEGKVLFRIGGNKHEEELIAAIKEGNLENVVKFEGFVSGTQKKSLLKWADIYILPSYNEGLPISILEAMSYKMPIISTPVGGIPEVVDSTNGRLIKPGDLEQLYNSIEYYISNPQMIKIQGEVSYNKVYTYLPDQVLNHLKLIYESLLS